MAPQNTKPFPRAKSAAPVDRETRSAPPQTAPVPQGRFYTPARSGPPEFAATRAAPPKSNSAETARAPQARQAKATSTAESIDSPSAAAQQSARNRKPPSCACFRARFPPPLRTPAKISATRPSRFAPQSARTPARTAAQTHSSKKSCRTQGKLAQAESSPPPALARTAPRQARARRGPSERLRPRRPAQAATESK